MHKFITWFTRFCLILTNYRERPPRDWNFTFSFRLNLSWAPHESLQFKGTRVNERKDIEKHGENENKMWAEQDQVDDCSDLKARLKQTFSTIFIIFLFFSFDFWKESFDIFFFQQNRILRPRKGKSIFFWKHRVPLNAIWRQNSSISGCTF